MVKNVDAHFRSLVAERGFHQYVDELLQRVQQAREMKLEKR